ncbi:S-formylglutathione hydrolase FrmB [Gracilibacillus orientalis]|uniref:S-formylglutathione hydrolase FrmB n=1 Tax=Gracilibacillus orientalis TaxID=334253 RepID=A0A1I4NCL0_9BACI|nr:alpha/beta hydrolase-fold protein [Gracilibacillus orientalis]SFM13125.1 S-formylglutathione hydrolase FrmB [Gracilibacillus orientalis]
MAWLHVHHHSEILGMPVQMEVLLPQSSGGDPRRYSTLYLLHDMGEGHTSWLRKTNVERYAEEFSLAVVMPAGHRSYYANKFYGKSYFTFIKEELPAICERMFPLSQAKEDRYIAGSGIGGYGALKAGLFTSHIFSKVGSFSSPIDIAGIADRVEVGNAVDIFGPLDELNGSRHDLYAATALTDPSSYASFYLSCHLEDVFLGENESFAQHLTSLGVSQMFEKIQTRNDGWEYTDYALEQFIRWLSQKNPDISLRRTK